MPQCWFAAIGAARASLLSLAAAIALLSLRGGVANAADVFRINGDDDVGNFLVTCDTSCAGTPAIEVPLNARTASPSSAFITISDGGPAAIPPPAGVDPATGLVSSFSVTFGNGAPTAIDTTVYTAASVGRNVTAVATVAAAKAAGLFDALPELASWSLTVPIAGTLLINESPSKPAFNGSSVFTGPEDTPPATHAVRLRSKVETAAADAPAVAPKGFTFDYSTPAQTGEPPQAAATTSPANDASNAASDANTNRQTEAADTTDDADATPDTSASSPGAAAVLYLLTGTNPGSLSATVVNYDAAVLAEPNLGQAVARIDAPVIAGALAKSVLAGPSRAASSILPGSNIVSPPVTSVSVTVIDQHAEPTYESPRAETPTDPLTSIVDSLNPYRPAVQRK